MKKYQYYRITVLMPKETYEKVIALAEKERRGKSDTAALLIEDGLKMLDHKENGFKVTLPPTINDYNTYESY